MARCPNRTENYGYDAVDQLVSADYGPRSEVFEYDAVGNRVRVVDSASGTTEYGRNNLNQYTSIGATTPTYDSNGNLTSSALGEYTYDAGNRLVTAASGSTTAGFAYDALNRQVSRTLNGVTIYLVYDGWNLIAEYDSSGSLKTKYIHGARADEILAKIDASGTAVYYHHDGLGSTAALTNSAGALLESYHYDAFGQPTIYNSGGSPIPGSAYGNRFMFAGREYLAELKLYDSRNRFYSPELGRFLQADPLRFGAGDANIYRYVGNRPSNAIDPLGLCEDDNPLGFGPSEDFVDDLTKSLLDESGSGNDGPVAPRFDADGKLELGEANEWYRNGNGQPVAVDADCYDFSQVNPAGFDPATGQQSYTFPWFKDGLPSDDFLVNGTVTLRLDSDGQSFSVLADRYNFEMHEGQPTRNFETVIANVIANPNPFTHGTEYPIIFYNSVPLPQPSGPLSPTPSDPPPPGW